MRFLDFDTIASINVEKFRETKPFPWVNPSNFLTEEGYAELIKTLPEISYFDKDFGKPRKYGQKPHDRYRLSYDKKLDFINTAWHDFVTELHGQEYQSLIKKLFNIESFELRAEWHYAESGGQVTPHLDGPTNYGAQLFYLITKENWKQEWGGQTLILGNEKSMFAESNPEISDFTQVIAANCVGNNTLIFKNTENAWHSVKEFTPPSGVHRKIFSIFITKHKGPEPGIGNKLKQLFSFSAQ